MLYLRMYRAEIRQEQLEKMDALKARLATRFRPLLWPALEAAGQILEVPPEDLRRRRELLEPRGAALDGEVFCDGKNLILVSLHPEAQRRQGRLRRPPPSGEAVTEVAYRLGVHVIGPTWEPDSLSYAVSAAEDVFGIKLTPHVYTSDHFDALKAEGREPPPEPSPAEQQGAKLLQDRGVRALALAIKSSGGLLVRDLPKQLPPDDRLRLDALTSALRDGGLVESEIVIVCSKSQAQVTRAPSREVLDQFSGKGLKCACGRPLTEERTEEAVAITDLGRSLLDKARWLTVLLLEELRALGVAREVILVEQTVGGDEIDCIANISGELALFELKDKEFSLGNAYSLGAKIGITRPDHAVIVTTERVGNDAKDHFVRARLAGISKGRPSHEFLYDIDVVAWSSWSEDREPREITYIEGVENLTASLEGLVSAIYRKDAAALLDRVVPLAALEGQALVRALERKGEGRAAVQQRDAADGAVAGPERRR